MHYPENERRRVYVHGIGGFDDGWGTAIGEDDSYDSDPKIRRPYHVVMDDGRTITANWRNVDFDRVEEGTA